MKDVIEFLNIANMAQLTAIPGIQTSLAESLIAARPYGAKADVLKVKGIGPSMFARIEAAAQEVESDQEIEEIKADKTITVPAYDQPLKMYEPEPPKPKQTGAFRRFMRAFFRVLLWLVVIAGIIGVAGAAFYYGLPYIQRTFIDPLNANTAQIEAIASQQAEDLTALDEKIAALETQVSQFENDLTARDERIAQLESDLADLEESTLAGQDALSAQLREETVIAFSLEL
ncbi:MAG: helix-hairpin-helix domain-containing protein, partial [Anaerolineales bacterium]